MERISEPIRILHVDDEPDFADLTATFLQREYDQFTVETALDAEEGVAALKEFDADCIVSDYEMPGQNGIEFLKTIREIYPDIPFILYTGKGSEEVASEAIAAGVTEYLQKEHGTDQYTILANRIINAVAHHRANEKIERQHDLFDKAQELASVGAWEYDIRTDTFYNTDEVLRIHGLQPDANFDAEKSIEYYHSDDRPRIREAFQQAIDVGEPYDLELRLIDDNGTQRWVRTQGEPQTEDGERVRVRGTIQDITERKQREQELETVLNRMNDAVFVHDEEGSFMFVNQTTVDRYGYKQSTFENMTPKNLDVSDEAKDVSNRIDRIMQDGQVTFETTHRTVAGEVFPVEVNATRISFRGTTAILAIARDISDRKIQEQKLQQFREAVEQTAHAVYITDDNGRIEYVNEAFEEITGYSENEAIGQTPRILQSGEYDDDHYEEFWETIQSGEDWNEKMIATRANDEEIVLLQSVSPITDNDGKPSKFVTVAQNITRRQAYQDELEEYATIIEALTDAVYVLDEEGKFTYVNDEFVEFVGYDRETVLGNAPSLIKDEATVKQAKQQLGRLLSSDGPETVTFEVEIQPKNGDPIICQDHMGVLPFDGDEFDGSVGVLRDITERKERERQLKREQQRYTMLFEALPNPVLHSRTEHSKPIVQMVNQAFTDTFGYDTEAVAGDPIQEYIVPDDRADAAERHNQEVLTSGDVRTEVQRETTDGVRTFRLNVSTRQTENGDHERYAVYTDITERKRREQELERQNQRLDEFTSIVSHDLRNPLTVAENYLELAQEGSESDHVAQAADAIDRSQVLIEDLLTLAREGDMVDSVETMSLRELAEHSWQTVETEQATLDVEMSCVINADPDRLQQLFENLYGNAIEHGGDDVTVSVGEIDDGFYVADTGSGIPEADRGVIFESGYSTNADGTGFGLRIVEQIVEAHGWEIGVTASDQGGARFEITGVEPAE